VTVWFDLYRQHQRARSSGDKKWSTEVRNRLNRLMEHCDAPGWQTFTKKANGGLEIWEISGGPLQLGELPGVASAKLQVLVRSATNTGHIHEFNVLAEGTRGDGSPWTIAVHLPDDRRDPEGDRQGLGACSHAALHCHVGPTLDHEPKVRVPLPALSLPDVLDWIIVQIIQDQDFEPARWADLQVAAALTPAPKTR
jgi:hypothetical protein